MPLKALDSTRVFGHEGDYIQSTQTTHVSRPEILKINWTTEPVSPVPALALDMNPVRAGIVEDPKDYRFCGYGEAMAGRAEAAEGLLRVWADHLGQRSAGGALQAHRALIFGMGGDPMASKGRVMDRKQVVKVLEKQDGVLPRSAVLRCRIRYFTDGAILGSAEYVRGFTHAVQKDLRRKRLPEVNPLRGADWGDIAVIQSLRRQVFS